MSSYDSTRSRERERETDVERVELVNLLLAHLGRRDVDDAKVAQVPPRLSAQDGFAPELCHENRARAGERPRGGGELGLDDELVGEVQGGLVWVFGKVRLGGGRDIEGEVGDRDVDELRGGAEPVRSDQQPWS